MVGQVAVEKLRHRRRIPAGVLLAQRVDALAHLRHLLGRQFARRRQREFCHAAQRHSPFPPVDPVVEHIGFDAGGGDAHTQAAQLVIPFDARAGARSHVADAFLSQGHVFASRFADTRAPCQHYVSR